MLLRVRERRAGASALCLAILVGGAAILSAADQQPIQLSSFVIELDRLLAVMPGTSPAGLAAVRDNVPDGWVVRTGQGDIPVPAAWLRRQLEEGRRDSSGWPARRADIVARLAALRREAMAAQSVSPPPATQADRAVLTDVLEQKEFRQHAAVTPMSRLRRAIADWLMGLWQWMGGERLGRRSTAVAFAWAAGVAALLALGWWIARALRTPRDKVRVALSAPATARVTARAWALQAAAAADPRESARCAYRAAVMRLEEEGAWRADDARTPREHVGLLPSTHRRRQVFVDVVRRFEEIWFGGRPASGEDARETVARLKELGCLSAD
jgi:hypothetical protein